MRFVPSTEPPRLEQWLLAVVTPRADRRFLLSDLQEEYDERVHRDGTAVARRWYRWQVRHSLAASLRRRLRAPGSPSPPWASESPRPSEKTPAIDPGVPAHWRPAAAVPKNPINRGFDMHDLFSDLRVAARSLGKNPQVLAVTVLSLALGIAAVTAVFSVADAFFFRSGNAPSPEDLLVVFSSEDDGEPYGVLSMPDYQDVNERVSAFAATTAFRFGLVNVQATEGPSETLAVELVTGRYFDVLGVQPALGRGFTPEEADITGAERVVVLSHDYWRHRLGGDPEVLGQSVRIDGHPFTVVGVAPEGMVSRLLGLRVQAWLPIGVPGGLYRATQDELSNRADREYRVLARLEPGSSLAQARAQLEGLAGALHAEHRHLFEDDRGEPRTLTAVPDQKAAFIGDLGAGLTVMSVFLFLASGAILALACSNAASLFLARAHQRRREMAVRLAIGSSRRRLITMLLVESLVPALFAGVLGFGLARLGVASVDTLQLPIGAELGFGFEVDRRAFAVALGIALVTSLVFGLFPALESARTDLVSGLKTDSTGRQGRLGLRRLIVVAQVAASLLFLLGASLGLRGVLAAGGMDPGFATETTALMSRTLRPNRFSPEAGLAYVEQETARLLRHAEVEDVQWTTTAELSFIADIFADAVRLDGDEEGLPIPSNAVTPGYFDMRGIRLLRGRELTPTDVDGAPEVAVINEAMARRLWPEEDALGRRFTVERTRTAAVDGPASQTLRVVGVAADGHYSDHQSADRPYFWTPLAQSYGWRLILHVAGRGVPAERLVAILQREVETFDDEVALIVPSTYQSVVDFRLQSPRMAAQALAGGGVFGLVLATLGIYGLLSFLAVLRSREMAVRQALGANRGQILTSLVRDGIKLSAWGIAVGLLLGLPLSYLARGVLYGVSPIDPWAVGGSSLLLVGAAALASLLPARRLSRESPVSRLRAD